MRACSGCRCRKVRCDVTVRGAPCTSCRFYDISGSIPIDRRGKGIRESGKDMAEKTVSDNEIGTFEYPTGTPKKGAAGMKH